MVEFLQAAKIYPVVDDVRVGEQTGTRVAISADGNTALLASYVENAVYVLVPDGPLWVTQASLAPADASEVTFAPVFGWAVAISADGNTAIVSDPHDGLTDTDDPEIGGAVYVFVRSGESWSQQGAKLVTPDPFVESALGWDVALSADGDTALVGDVAEHRNRDVLRGTFIPGDPPSVTYALENEEVWRVGSAYVMVREDGEWSMQAKLFPADDGPYQGSGFVGTGAHEDGAEFGSSVALSADGNTAAVCGPEDYTGPPSIEASVGWLFENGSFWTYFREAGVWAAASEKMQSGFPNDGEASGAFGGGVAVSADGGSAVVIGSTYNSYPDEPDATLWFYTLSDGAPTFTGKTLASDDGALYQVFSVAMSEDGSVVVAGSGLLSIGDTFARNRAWLLVDGAFQERIADPDDMDGDAAFGSWVSMTPDALTLLVGGPGDNPYMGAAWIYTPTGPVVSLSLHILVPLRAP